MKKFFLLYIIIILLATLVGCKQEEIVNVSFIIEGKTQVIEVKKGTSLTRDMIPVNNVEEVELYYDKEYKNKFDNGIINNDIVLYVKNKLERLDDDTTINIKTSYIKNFCNKDTHLNEIIIEGYYGCYNDYYAVLIKELNKGDTGVIRKVIIENLIFNYPFDNREILLYKNDSFTTLDKAFENEYIIMDDLVKIYQLYTS